VTALGSYNSENINLVDAKNLLLCLGELHIFARTDKINPSFFAQIKIAVNADVRVTGCRAEINIKNFTVPPAAHSIQPIS
jgi:uncharacterized protein YabE (DUF348 family)